MKKPMKKPVMLTIVFAMALLLTACGSEYVKPADKDLEYHYDEAYEGVIITAYNGEAPKLRIPAKLDGNPVKQVSLKENSNITHIELPDSVTEIGESAFAMCSSLTEITIPDSVTEIGVSTFCGCDGLKVTYHGQEYTSANDPGNWWWG